MNISNSLKKILMLFHKHNTSNKKEIFILSTPRSGSTWLMELIATQPNIKIISEPLNPKNKKIISRYNINIKERYISENMDLTIYFKDLLDGNLINSRRFSNILSKNHNFITNRSVVKLLRGNELFELLNKEFDLYFIYLMRHPIPTCLSRIRNNWKQYTNLYLNNNRYKNKIKKLNFKFIQKKLNSATKFEKFIYSWCFENYSIYNKISTYENSILITYEDLVINFDNVISFLYDKLNLEKKELIFRKKDQPSSTIKYSKNKTKNKINNKEFLIRKWENDVSKNKEKKVMDILDIFNIDIYSFGNFMPKNKYLIE